MKIFVLGGVGLMILIVSVGLITNSNNSEVKGESEITDSDQRLESDFKNNTLSDDRGAVTVEATPIKIGNTEKETIFEVSLNTHSVDLTYDYVEIISLYDNFGNKYEASFWDGNNGGHHVGGQVIFPNIAEDTTSLTLKIKNVDGIDREFSWNI